MTFLLVVGAFLALSFLFSGMEAGVAALSRLRIRHRMKTGDARAAVLHGFMENPENFLWTILVGNTLANFAAVTLLVNWLMDSFIHRRGWLLFGLAALVVLLFTLFELLPKMLFRTFPNRLCLALARPFRAVHFALSPLVAGIERLSERLVRLTGVQAFKGHFFGTREELRFVMQESAAALTSEERAMVNRVLDLQNLTVGQLVLPLEKAVTVEAGATAAEVIRLCRDHKIGRLPVWQSDGQSRRIVGVVRLNAVLFSPDGGEGRRAADFVQPAVFVEEGLRLELALDRLRRAGQRVAVVVGADGRERGLIGMQDILKFVFGEVPQ
ncbi:MAG TPA: CNNM domain-containing protein [Verrucomicrobiae bacterium]